MNFVLQTPSLQHVAGVNIVSHLWSQRDIFTQILRACNSEPHYDLNVEAEEWIEIEEKVESEVSALPLPEQCKKHLISLIKPLGAEFITWLEDSNGYNFLALLLPQQLRWTMHGAVDYKKTAELMVRDARVSVDRRYQLACINCLEDEARQLFKLLPIKRKREYINGDVEFWCREHRLLTQYFTWTLCGYVKRLKREYEELLSPGESIHKYLFKEMLCTGSDRAMGRYFFEKFNPDERERAFEEVEKKMIGFRLPPARSFMYFLPLMNEEQRGRVIQRCNYGVLIHLLDWPEQFFFLDIAQREWPSMQQAECAWVLTAIVVKITRRYLHFDYVRLFWECWRMSPAEYKRFYLDDATYAEFLLFTEREEFIELVLNESRLLLTKEELIFDERYRELFMNESAISLAALRECKERAELNSSDENQDEEKRWRNQHLCQFLDVVMRRRRFLRGEEDDDEDSDSSSNDERLRSRHLAQLLDIMVPERGEEEESDDVEDSDDYGEFD